MWEYLVRKIEDIPSVGDLEEVLNGFGNENWELFFMDAMPGGGIAAFFKREKRQNWFSNVVYDAREAKEITGTPSAGPGDGNEVE